MPFSAGTLTRASFQAQENTDAVTGMRLTELSGLEDFGMVSSNRGPGATEGSKRMGKDGKGANSDRVAHIDPRVQTEIGKHLRAVYDDVINEPVPNRFMELLEKLERSQKT